MWIEHYNELADIEKERFASVCAFLLSKSFLTREVYENKSKIGKINADYRFVERYLDIFEGYFKIMGYRVLNNEMFGFIYLENDYGYNRMRLDKLTTLILFTLRTIYDEEKEKNATSNVVYLNVGSLIFKLLDINVVSKKPTIKEMSDSLRLLINHNVITKIEGSIEDSACLIAIMPTILEVVSNEKINAIYDMVFGESDKAKASIEIEEDLEVFNL